MAKRGYPGSSLAATSLNSSLSGHAEDRWKRTRRLLRTIGNTAMADVAAFYASLPGAPVGAANSKPPAKFIAKRVSLPADLSGFTHYMTFNHKRRKQLRKVYANRVAIEAAKADRALPDGSVIVVEAFKAKMGPDKKPIVGADEFYVSTGRAGFTAMERQSGWGGDFPVKGALSRQSPPSYLNDNFTFVR